MLNYEKYIKYKQKYLLLKEICICSEKEDKDEPIISLPLVNGPILPRFRLPQTNPNKFGLNINQSQKNPYIYNIDNSQGLGSNLNIIPTQQPTKPSILEINPTVSDIINNQRQRQLVNIPTNVPTNIPIGLNLSSGQTGGDQDLEYYEKYLKYKQKYLLLKEICVCAEKEEKEYARLKLYTPYNPYILPEPTKNPEPTKTPGPTKTPDTTLISDITKIINENKSINNPIPRPPGPEPVPGPGPVPGPAPGPGPVPDGPRGPLQVLPQVPVPGPEQEQGQATPSQGTPGVPQGAVPVGPQRAIPLVPQAAAPLVPQAAAPARVPAALAQGRPLVPQAAAPLVPQAAAPVRAPLVPPQGRPLVEQGINLVDGNPQIEHVVINGGFNAGNDIHQKIQRVYNAYAGYFVPIADTNEYFYVQNRDRTNIVSIVGISNTNNQLDDGVTIPALRDLLLAHRLAFIMRTKPDMYVFYTTIDATKDEYARTGMVCTPPNRREYNGINQWRLEYNRPAKTLVTHTKFPIRNPPDTRPDDVRHETCVRGGPWCTGIQLSKMNGEAIIYTAAHCLRWPLGGDRSDLPCTVIYPDAGDVYLRAPDLIEIPVGASHRPRYTLPPNTTNENELDDVGIFYTNLLLDTSNIYILDNPQDLPENYASPQFKSFGMRSSNQYGNRDWMFNRIGTDAQARIIINTPGFLNPHGYDLSGDLYKRYIRKVIVTNNIPPGEGRGGDSGGPNGIFFGVGGKKFALVGTTSGEQEMIPVAARFIPWLRELGMRVNVAHYNPDGTITEVP